MKKYLYIALAAAALTSCSSDETLDVQKEAISFGEAFIGNSTRATDPSYGPNAGDKKLTAFKVYGTVEGTNIFDGDNVTKGDAAYGTEAWGCDGATQYWIAGADYIFDAVVDATSTTTDQTTGLPTKLTYNTSSQKDMLHNRVITNGKPTTNNGLVTFEFTHLLSKVNFTVTNETAATATNYRYTITDINITNAYTVGDYAVPAGTWDNLTTAPYAIDDITANSASTAEAEAEVLLIPGANVGVSFNANIEYKKSDDTWVVISTVEKAFTNQITLAANTAYNFNVTVKLDDEIKFTAKDLNAWTNADDTDLTI